MSEGWGKDGARMGQGVMTPEALGVSLLYNPGT